MRSPFLLLVVGLLAGCAGRLPGPATPAGHAPLPPETVASWVEGTTPVGTTQLRFTWQLLDERGAGEGRGAAQLAAPDSLRFDFRCPLGSCSGAAAVIGDVALWAEPADEVEKLVPSYPILWAMLGRARGPASGDVVSGIETARVRAWRYVSGRDTVDYVLSLAAPRELVADVRQDGQRLGRVVTELDAEGWPVRSRLDVPSGPARVTLTFTERRALDSIPAERWVAPADAP